MKDLLSDLKDACGSAPSRSDVESIRQGQSTWFIGRPTNAPEGTIALALSGDAKVIINEGDVRSVKKVGEYYSVEVSSEANFLFRVEKIVKATVQPACNCGENRPPIFKTHDDESKGGVELEITEITICKKLCFDFEIVKGYKIPVCILVDCETTKY